VKRIVVLGVGTNIGKTWVASALARSAPPGTCLALKPIETGTAPDSRDGDAALLSTAAGHPFIPPLYALREPVTPWLAADLERRSIELQQVASWTKDAESMVARTTLRATTCIVETAGGAFSPLSLSTTNLDLAHCLGPATWILVAPNRLGALHDVGATLEAMRSSTRLPDLLLLNDCCPADASTDSNLSLLRRLHPALPILPVSSLEPPTLRAVDIALGRT